MQSIQTVPGIIYVPVAYMGRIYTTTLKSEYKERFDDIVVLKRLLYLWTERYKTIHVACIIRTL